MKRILSIIAICLLLLTGCMERAETGEDHSAAGQTAEPAEKQVAEGGSGTGSKDSKDRIDLSFKPNEAGKIMVLMYHNIGEEEGEWVRTPANFIRDMETLYQKGYRPISLKDYVSGNITTEQGYTPVVITFDDGNLNNFEYLENGEIREDCAVGLLLGFHNEHKDFPLEATFFLNGEQPFRQSSLIDKKLNFIVENGMDIGNHTKDHNSFRNMDAEEIQRQIGSEAQFLEHIFGSSDYEVNTLALPFGERPKDGALMKYLTEGTYDDIPYTNIAVLNVGWNPAYSPYDKKFDHSSIPRIRASEMKVDNVGIYNYIDYFDKHPEERFISDGIAEVITIPEEKKELLIHDSGREVYLYSPGEE